MAVNSALLTHSVITSRNLDEPGKILYLYGNSIQFLRKALASLSRLLPGELSKLPHVDGITIVL